MQKCPKCGSEIKEEEKRCLNCGADITKENVQEELGENETKKHNKEISEKLKEFGDVNVNYKENKGSKNRKILIIVLSIIAVIILVIVGMFASGVMYVKDGELHFGDKVEEISKEKIPVVNSQGEIQTDPDGNELYQEPVIDSEGNVVTDEDGHIIYNRPITDEDGNVVVDNEGQVVYEQATDPYNNDTVPVNQGTEKETEKQSNNETTDKEEETEKQTEEKTEKETEKQTEKATEKETEKETEKPATSTTTVQINGKDYKVGDTIIYTVKISDVSKPVVGLNVQVNYNSSMLEIDEDGMKFPEIGNPVYNIDLKDMMLFNSVDLDGYDFSKENVLVEIPFIIKDSNVKSSEISTEILEFMDFYGNPLEATTITESIKKK